MLNRLNSYITDNDELVFAEDHELIFDRESQEKERVDSWKIMVVDDDTQVHEVTKLTLKGFTFEGKSLNIISAYSGKEAKHLIATHPDTTLILLDLVMETNDAGLRVAQHIREVLKNNSVRIILQTEQWSEDPETPAILNYDINDHKSKLELTGQKLFTTIIAGLRSYRDVSAAQKSRQELAALYANLQGCSRNLEQLVKTRTQELEEKNLQLQQEISERERALRQRQQAEDALRESAIQLRNQNAVLIELARNKALHDGDLKAALREITESTAHTLGIERVSVWLYDKTQANLRCLDLFEQSPNRHSEGIQLAVADYPAYFQALAENQLIAAHDAHTDPRTREFSESYLTLLGITSMLDTPIRLGGQTVGVLCVERVGKSRNWTPEEQNFARSIADLVSLVLEARERKRAEKALRESEERWQLVLRGNNDGIWDWNIKTNEAFISPRWKEMLGYEDHEIENHHNEWISRVHPDDLDWIMEALQAHLDRKTPYSFSEYRLRCKDGSYKWILSRGQALWDEEGKPVRMVGSNTDITERKQREEALRLIVEGTAAKTGSDFFRSCTRYLAQVLQVRYALITKFANKEKTRVCTLAFWQGKDFGNNFEYDLASTSSEAIDGTKCYYSESTQALFRKDPDLAKLNAQSYLGIPLVDSSGNVLGYLAVLDSAPIIKDPGKELILKIFAARAGAELERKIAEEALQQQAEKDSLLSSISRQFIDQDIDTAINFTLQALGEFTGSDRSYIIRYSDCQSLLSATHSWCDDGIVPCMENYQEFSVETFPWFSEQLMGGNPVNISLVADLPLEAATEKAKLENDATKSLLIVPMINADKTVGYLGLDAVRSPKVWTHEDIGLLKLVGEFIAIAQARHQAEEALRESQARFAGILDNANEAIISVDETQRITLFNYGAEQTFGYTSSEVLGQPLDLLLPTRFAEIHSQHIADFDQASKTARKMGGGRPVFGRRKDGTEFMAEVSISKLDLGGRKVFTAIVRDITERKQAEEALQKAKEAADAANRAKSEFLASMSHELRTPLNAILGFTQVMNRDLSLSTEQQQNLGIISRSGEHLLELINDILEMSKIEAGRTTFNKSSFDLYRLVDNLEEMLRLKADAKSLQLIFERTSEVPQYVQTDEGKLRQVLINLLGNAIKFTEEGGVTLRVGMGHESFVKDKEHLTIHLEIEDTGPGIAPEEVDKLFAAFGQTETGRKSQQGTGLGLPISKKFVQLMGGDITVSSILDRGTVFAFDIQVSLADASEIQTIQPRRKVIGLAPDQPKYRILVVDDRLESRLLLLKLLASMGFSVREAANGQEAIDLWSSWEPHLIWMDMRMPVIDGYEATKYIKATTKGQATVIIALTASAFEEDRAVVLSAGCNDFMRKPFREEVLWEKMAQHLGVRYIYEEPESNAQSHRARERAKSPLDQPLDFHLSQMPSEWIQQLQQAAAECSDDLILELIEQIPEENAPLAIALKDLAENFLFDKLIEVTQLR